MIDLAQLQIYALHFFTILMAFIAFRFFMTWMKSTEHMWKIWGLKEEAKKHVEELKKLHISDYEYRETKKIIEYVSQNGITREVAWMKENYLTTKKALEEMRKEVTELRTYFEISRKNK